MKKWIFLLLVILFQTQALFACNYPFEGIEFINIADFTFSFKNGQFEESRWNEYGECIKQSYPYVLKTEGAYLVAYITKNGTRNKIYIFNADKNHIILYDSGSKKVIVGTEKKGHRDEPWIYSVLNPQTTSSLTETLRGEKITYPAENLNIENLALSWVEGVDGFGKGEVISFKNRINGSRRIYIINGFFSPDKPSLFYENNRIKDLTVRCYKDNEVVAIVHKTLKDTGKMQVIEFSERYEKFDFLIEDVYQGRKYNDTALTGIFLDALDCFIK